jgi:alkylated DNA repair dioxygenase AlkB
VSRESSGVQYQRSLFEALATAVEPSFEAAFAFAQRVSLDDEAWIDLVPGWVSGSDRLFEQVARSRAWGQRTRWMYDREVVEPRMTARWTLASGEPLDPPVLEAMRQALSARYGVVFDSAGFNLYRDGKDSVAWHRDRIHEAVHHPIVPLVSLGEPRKLLFRPHGGGPSRAFPIGHGDLLVTGGAAQRAWEHAILKVPRAGARISVAFRYGADLGAYDAREVTPSEPETR